MDTHPHTLSLSAAEAMLAAVDARIAAAASDSTRCSTPPSPPAPPLPDLYEQRRRIVAHLPHFWLRVLQHHPAFALQLTPDDARLLHALHHLDVQDNATQNNNIQNNNTAAAFTLIFHFAPNALLAAPAALRKQYLFSERCGRVVRNDPASWRVAPPTSGFAFWLTADTADSAHLGELLRHTVFPRAADLYFNTYTLQDDDDDDDDDNHRNPPHHPHHTHLLSF